LFAALTENRDSGDLKGGTDNAYYTYQIPRGAIERRSLRKEVNELPADEIQDGVRGTP